MATFPLLKTGAVMQYPAKATIRYSNRLIKFVDGGEQRYRDTPAPLHEWLIRLDMLDEAEMKAFEEFFVEQEGQFGSFLFTDPKDSVQYPDCSLMIDDFDFTLDGERRGKTSMVVKENRS
jgi:phage-related protein